MWEAWPAPRERLKHRLIWGQKAANLLPLIVPRQKYICQTSKIHLANFQNTFAKLFLKAHLLKSGLRIHLSFVSSSQQQLSNKILLLQILLKHICTHPWKIVFPICKNWPVFPRNSSTGLWVNGSSGERKVGDKSLDYPYFLSLSYLYFSFLRKWYFSLVLSWKNSTALFKKKTFII